MSDKKLYKLDDHILFRKCDLYDGCDTQHGDCTNFKVKQVHCQDNYFCNQEGLHFHCARHPEIEYDNNLSYIIRSFLKLSSGLLYAGRFFYSLQKVQILRGRYPP